MAFIDLPCGARTIIDDDDIAKCAVYTWHSNAAGYVQGWSKGSAKNRHRTYLHRLVAGAITGQVVDHVNFDVLDNRKGNLRLTINRLNIAKNRRIGGETGYKGVKKNRNKFAARGWKNGVSIHLGVTESAIYAAHLYDLHALREYGVFASLNFPIEGLSR